MTDKYKLIKNSFFNSYKAFIDVIMLTNDQNNIYNILVLRKDMHNDLTMVNVIVRSIHNNDEEAYHEYISNMMLNNIEASNLINDIRCDFRDNHHIVYSSVNPSTKIQTLQNTRFSLNIKLMNDDEYDNAIKINEDINKNSSRYKVLTRC